MAKDKKKGGGIPSTPVKNVGRPQGFGDKGKGSK